MEETMHVPTFSFLDKYRDTGLLVMRVGLGVIYLFHGWPKISGGPELWAKVGGAIDVVGIGFAPVFWGFMASCSEFFGALLLIFGLFSRPALAFMSFTMFIATVMLISSGQSYAVFSHPLKMVVVFLSLILIGPGRFSLDSKLSKSGN